MRKCQFIKVSMAPLSQSGKSRARKGRKPISRFSIARLIAEALRRPEFSPHVKKPKKPEILSGCNPEEILTRIKLAIANRPIADGAKRRKFRPDKRIAICIVISYPIDKARIEADPAEKARFFEWAHAADRQQNEEWRARGVEPLSTIIHLDENYYHLHKFMIPSLVPTLSARAAHPGCSAWRSTFEATHDKEASGLAYKAAMAEFQDRFFLAVSSQFGHERFGDRYVRQTRADAIRSNDRQRTEARLNYEKAQELAAREAALAKAERAAVERAARQKAQRARLAGLLWRARSRLSSARAMAKASVTAAKLLQSTLLKAMGSLPAFLSKVSERAVEVARKLDGLPAVIEARISRRTADEAHGILQPFVNDLNELGADIADQLELLGTPGVVAGVGSSVDIAANKISQ